MSVYKTGITTSNHYYENNGVNIYTGQTNSFSYTPAAGTNKCMEELIPAPDSSYEPIRYRVELDIVYSGFTNDNPDGSLNIHSNHTGTNSAGTMTWSNNPFDEAWEGYVNANATNLTSLVLSQESGTFHVDTYTRVLNSTDVSYKSYRLSVRCDYSNGTATFAFNNVKITPSYATGDKVQVRENSVTANDFIEI